MFISCKKDNEQAFLTKIITGPGPEDIVHDVTNNRILISCSERRTGYPAHGEIWQMPVGQDTSFILPRTNFPAGVPFRPHGFDLQTVHGILYLYVINHYGDEDHTTAIDRFIVFADRLEYEKSYLHPLQISPNDLTVLADGSFYYSNDQGSSNILDLVTKPYSGSVAYCDGISTWKKVDSGIAYPNGLYNENGKLYVATSRNKALYKYDITGGGSLQNRILLNSIDGMDNIIAHEDELIIAVHPDILKFVALSFAPEKLSPCKTYSINKNTGSAKLLFDTDGSMVSGVSTSLIIGHDLYMGQVFSNYLLKISNYSNRK
jgi:hypothetical protein